MPHASLQQTRQHLDVLAPIAQHDRRTPLGNDRQHILHNLPIARRVLDQRGAQDAKGETPIGANAVDRHSKRRRPHMDDMVERLAHRQRLRIDAMTDRAALHHDERMLSVLAVNRGGQPQDIARGGRDNRLAERRPGRKNARVGFPQFGDGQLLSGPQFAPERRVERDARIAPVRQHGVETLRLQHALKAAARHLQEPLAVQRAGNDARLPIDRILQPLTRVEFGISERGKTNQPAANGGRQTILFDIDAVRQHDVHVNHGHPCGRRLAALAR